MQPGERGQGQHKGRHFEQPTGVPTPTGAQPPSDTGAGDMQGAAGAVRGKQKPQERPANYVAPAGGPAGGGPAAAGGEPQGKGQGKGEGKKHQQEASPVPSPQ